MNRVTFGLLLITFAAFSAGCGWHLRGSGADSIDLTHIQIDNRMPKHERGPESIEHSINYQLRIRGVGQSNSEVDSQGVLVLLSESQQEKVLSITSDLFEQQVRIQKTVAYQITNLDGEVLSNTESSAFRDITEDQSRVAAKNRERQLLLGEINEEIANKILLSLQNSLGTASRNQPAVN